MGAMTIVNGTIVNGSLSRELPEINTRIESEPAESTV